MLRLVLFELSRRTRYRILLAVGFPAVFALTLWSIPAKTGTAQTGEGDLGLFRAVVDGERAGRPYYDVYGAESRSRGYPTRSVFNWREPLLMRTLALLPRIAGKVLLIVLAVAFVWQAHGLLRRELLGIVTVLNASVMAAVPGNLYFTEPWAGFCLGLSALAYARRRETTGASWALLALFIRELAAPYCVVAGLIALSRRRWREVAVWAGGATVYTLYFGAHVWQIWQHALPGDQAHTHSWLYFGGLPFVAQVWRMNGILAVVPVPLFALAVVMAVAASWARQMPLHVRAGVLTYSVLFLFVGLPFNTYWGDLIAPLVGLWLVYAPTGLNTLWAYAELPRSLTDLTPDGVVALTAKPGNNG
jgi:hypothetical protein